MFEYRFRINTETMEVNVIPFLAKDYGQYEAFAYRPISYPNNKFPDIRFNTPLFFEIEKSLFPNYLRCENFPWNRLKNLQEALNFKLMYDQYNLLAKIPSDPVWLKPFDPTFGFGSSSIKITLNPQPVLPCETIIDWSKQQFPFDNPLYQGTSFATCSCECSSEYIKSSIPTATIFPMNKKHEV